MIHLPVVADWPGDLPAILLSIFNGSAEESSLVHELLRDAANINTGATETPLSACLKMHFERIQQKCLIIFKTNGVLRKHHLLYL